MGNPRDQSGYAVGRITEMKVPQGAGIPDQVREFASDARIEIDRLASAVAGLSARLAAAERETALLKSDVASLESRVTELEEP